MQIELTQNDIAEIEECLRSKVVQYRFQHMNVKIKGMTKQDHANGAAWIDRYEIKIQEIIKKLHP